MARLFSFLLVASPLALFLGIVAAKCPDPSGYKQVVLPWGTYTPTECDVKLDAYVFRNVRFGKATSITFPGGTPRFGPSQPPDIVPDPAKVLLPAAGDGAACLQINPTKVPDCTKTGDGGNSPNYGTPILAPPGDQPTSEDCLFLDVYVPVSALDKPSTANLPVIVWIYGGAYLFGSKDFGLPDGLPFYSGKGFMEAAAELGNQVIYVAGNYRLAQAGWLAGPTVQLYPSVATANAGLGDQYLMLQLVQKYIGLFGGNKDGVTVFGESAGGGSILHQLVAVNQSTGQPRDPLFGKALMQSAAFQWIWDNTAGGPADQTFTKFLNFSDCRGYTGAAAVACLQGLSTDKFQDAVDAWWYATKCDGVWNIGPVVDGRVITQLPAVSLMQPNFKFHPNVRSIVSSHVADEARFFVPSYVNATFGFDKLLQFFLPGTWPARQNQRSCITQRYNPPSTNQTLASRAVIQDSMFVCNVRYLFTAAQNNKIPFWAMDYSFFNVADLAVHATDLIPAFWNAETLDAPMQTLICKAAGIPDKECEPATRAYITAVRTMRKPYQRYFVSFAVTGDPTNRVNDHPWLTALPGEMLSRVVKVQFDTRYFVDINDPLTTQSTCGFWSAIATAVVNNVTVPSGICTMPKVTHDSEPLGFDEL